MRTQLMSYSKTFNTSDTCLDKANRFLLSPGVRTNESILYIKMETNDTVVIGN